MKLGFNTVLFGGHTFEDAFRAAKFSGYDGVEISAIHGMGTHLHPGSWKDQCPGLRALRDEYELELLAIEQPVATSERMEPAFAAAQALGVPVVNCGPGGVSGDEKSLAETISRLSTIAKMAEAAGVVLCVKAHVGQAIHDTPTSLRALEAIDSPAFGLDMDPSHVHRAGEDVVQALVAVVHRIRHVHIRDCKGRGPAPGTPAMQANGRGDIDLLGFVATLHRAGYTGALDLEVIGGKDLSLEACTAIAGEARGHMQACLQACGAR